MRQSMTVALTEPSGFASKWLPFQTAKRHVTNGKNPAKMFALSDWTKIAVANCLKFRTAILHPTNLPPTKSNFLLRLKISAQAVLSFL